jgi:hypothetical protein
MADSRKMRLFPFSLRKRVLPAQAGEAGEVIFEGAESEAVGAACAVLDGQMRVGEAAQA